MFKINKKIEYALIALKHISQQPADGLTSVKEICDLYKAPFDVVSRSMQKLVKHGVLQSEKGVNGGYKLQKTLKDITLLELVEIILGPVHVASCLDDSKCNCSIAATCNVISPILNLDQRLRQFLLELSLAELIETQNGQEAMIKEQILIKN